MAKIKIRYLVTRPKSNGTPRHYWQPDSSLRAAGWKMRRLSDDLATAIAEASEINNAVDEWRLGVIQDPLNHKAGSMDHLIEAYKNSREFGSLGEKTAVEYTRYLRLISDWAGTECAAAINSRMVQDLYDTLRDKTPRKAAYMVQVLRLLFAFAERQSLINRGTNPAARPMLDYKARKGTIWSPQAVRDFVATADEMGFYAIGTAVMLNEWMGQRRGDVIAVSMAAYRAGILHIRQSKTGADVALPVGMVPQLQTRIEEQIARNKRKDRPGVTLIQTQSGGPYTADGFMTTFEKVRVPAAKRNPEIAGLIFKDLRHTAVTRLAECGAEIPQIAAVTGHAFKSCQDIVDRYNVRTTKMARAAFEKRLETEETERTGK